MRFALFFIVVIMTYQLLTAQQPDIKEYIVVLDNDTSKNVVFLDLKSTETHTGELFCLLNEHQFFVHPETGKKIRKKDEVLAVVRVDVIHADYGYVEAKVISQKTTILKGSKLKRVKNIENDVSDLLRNGIAIYPFQVIGDGNDVFGVFFSDFLMEHIRNYPAIKIVDRKTLDLQLKEMQLGLSGVIDENTLLSVGKLTGIKYFILGTTSVPELQYQKGGVQLKTLLSAVESISGKKLGSDFTSDLKTEKMSAFLQSTLKIINVETGEVEFVKTQSSIQDGKSSLRFEGGVFNRIQFGDASNEFHQSITGRVVSDLCAKIAAEVNAFYLSKNQVSKSNDISHSTVEPESSGVKFQSNQMVIDFDSLANHPRKTKDTANALIIDDFEVKSTDIKSLGKIFENLVEYFVINKLSYKVVDNKRFHERKAELEKNYSSLDKTGFTLDVRSTLKPLAYIQCRFDSVILTYMNTKYTLEEFLSISDQSFSESYTQTPVTLTIKCSIIVYDNDRKQIKKFSDTFSYTESKVILQERNAIKSLLQGCFAINEQNSVIGKLLVQMAESMTDVVAAITVEKKDTAISNIMDADFSGVYTFSAKTGYSVVSSEGVFYFYANGKGKIKINNESANKFSNNDINGYSHFLWEYRRDVGELYIDFTNGGQFPGKFATLLKLEGTCLRFLARGKWFSRVSDVLIFKRK